MKFKILIAALLLSLALPAAADFRTIQEGYEIALSNVRLPQIDSGTIAFKACHECLYQTKRMSSDASWAINGKNTTLKKFRLRLSSLTERSDMVVTVLHHLEKDVVTRVSIWIP